MSADKKMCQKCGRVLSIKEFYTKRDGGKADLCKKCLTMHVDNFMEDTYLWIIQDLDYPYLPGIWSGIRDRAYAKTLRLNGTSVLGKYISQMCMTQWRRYTWADSERLQQEAEKRAAVEAYEKELSDQELQKDYEDGKISEAEYRTLVSAGQQYQDDKLMMAARSSGAIIGDTPFHEKDFISEAELEQVGVQLSDEDKIYLATKWGRLYKPSEWISLETHYKELEKGFDINDPDTKNSLILICKTDLKANQALDIGDFDSFNKLSRTYDTMRKSAKITAAQNKADKEESIDSIGQLVAYCEEKGSRIPRFDLTIPQDIIDQELADMKGYIKSLIYEDTTLAQQIENYLKQRAVLEQSKHNKQLEEEVGHEIELDDSVWADYNEFLESEQEEDSQDQYGFEEDED